MPLPLHNGMLNEVILRRPWQAATDPVRSRVQQSRPIQEIVFALFLPSLLTPSSADGLLSPGARVQ